ncbi:hypothetical protein [Rufibacter psychrotolerans]|uniref:hypothetical protein n=1 Tax=Rufibacter psychrotolerans TaxID=2812556 RepID=UPI0019678877|nr:hypothetical protein [Rufibacter sp. SYSU D00308]
MAFLPIILGAVALLVAGFTFYKVASILTRVQSLEKRNRRLEAEMQDAKEELKRLKRNQPQAEGRGGRGGQQPQAAQPQQRQPQEPRQKQQGGQSGRQQQQAPEQRNAQGQPPQKQPQEPRQKQPAAPRQPQEPKAPQEPRQRQGQPQGQPQAQPQAGQGNAQPKASQQSRRNEGRRREAASAVPPEATQTARPVPSATLGHGIVGDDLLNELTQTPPQPNPQTQPQPQPEEPVSRFRYAIIPEDGIIKSHQLQQRPDSDSYLEIDAPQEGTTSTRYRFNLGGNQAFVISQGMDRLENAFSFEKPSNRMVSRIVLQGDGVLTRTSSGWKIQEKARIDFR